MRAPCVLLLAACGRPDADIDAPPSVDGPCGADVFVTGELVDWDSGPASFCGVFDATLALHGDPTHSDRTAPNGRFELCVPAAATIDLDVTPPAGTSQCLSPTSSYAIPGRLVVARGVLGDGLVSARMMSVARAPDFGHDPARAQVFVHVAGGARKVTLSAPHGPPQQLGEAWTPGDTGTDVYFPDVDPSGGDATVTGGGKVPLAAGAFTWTTIPGG